MNRFRFYSPDDTPQAATSSPQTHTEAPDTPPASQVAEHVDKAATGAATVAKRGGNQGWKEVANELKGLRADISGLLTHKSEGSAAADSSESLSSSSAAADPSVEITPDTPQYRIVRRNGRKIKRKV